MADYNNGSNYIKGYTLKSIVDIQLDCGITLSAFPGSLSPNDILLKYKELRGTDRFRTPKHIHWVIDLMIKREHNKTLTNELLTVFKSQWEKIIPLISRDYEAIINSLSLSTNSELLEKYSTLNSYGYYKIDFIIHLMELLMLQEKTNYSEAYMFKNVINELLSGNDLFKLISTATHNGR